ncbi:hypothetical protein HCU67_00085 [Muricauda sp. DJ-13]|uniref:Carboxypeptidase-like regulatory domain-containing protein n=2 Tax=Croceivirga thetidis TaxID=2721623 RepID=A0ABX1GK99_9FLAO|nr:hypothetical protein [Croceivirga thetidis]
MVFFVAQGQNVKLLKGKVIAPGEDVTGVTIQNVSTKKATITDFEGNFSIEVRELDTLVFSAVQLKRKILPVTEPIFNSSFVRVPMQAFVNELREVVVLPYNLSGDLNTDAKAMNVAPVTAESLGLPNAHAKIPTQSERKLMQASYGKFNLGMLLSPPLDPLINMITGRTKMLKNRVAVDKKYAKTNAVEASIVDSLFLSELKIPKRKIADFMYFCEVDDEFQQLVSRKDQLLLWEYLLRRSKLYRENNELE